MVETTTKKKQTKNIHSKLLHIMTGNTGYINIIYTDGYGVAVSGLFASTAGNYNTAGLSTPVGCVSVDAYTMSI